MIIPTLLEIFVVVAGPMALFWAAAGAVFAPELVLSTPLPVRVALTCAALLLLALAVYFYTLGSISRGLAMVGLALLATPEVAYARHDKATVPLKRTRGNLRGYGFK